MRNLKGAIVERVEHHKTKRQGVVRLDKGSMTFFAWENDNDRQVEPFTSSSGAEVRRWLLDQLARTTDGMRLDWVPVVEIEQGEGRTYYSRHQQDLDESLAFTASRYFIALTLDKREWRRLKWEECDPESPAALAEQDRYAASTKYDEGPKSKELNRYTKAFTLPHFSDRGHSAKVVLPYTHELWAGLCLVAQHVADSRKMLSEVLGTRQGVARLAEIGAGRAQLLLTPGREG